MTFVICLLFAIGMFQVFEFSEDILLEDHIEADLSTFMDQYAVAPEIARIPVASYEVFIANNNDKSGFPEYLRNLPPGEDDVLFKGKALSIETRVRGDTTFYFVIEETLVENFEKSLILSLIIITAGICFISVLLGLVFSNHIIKPVTKLANNVNSMKMTGTLTEQPAFDGKDEIEVLSYAIESFQLRVNELLGRERNFSSDVSHELRTPLMGIQAAAENIQLNKDNSSRVLELASRIERRCGQMRSLIDSLLVLARDPGSLENDFDHIKLLEVINDQLDSVAFYIDSKNIKIKIVEKGSPQIISSEAILSVVVGNLLRNAVQHSESKEIIIELNPDGFTIKDFGLGMQEELKNRMFERNFSEGADKGHGIGLFLVKRLCDHFSWILLIETNPGKGTIITVNFGQPNRKVSKISYESGFA